MTYSKLIVCEHCGLEFGEVVSRNNKLALVLYLADGVIVHVFSGEITCAVCREVRTFVSVPMSAVRLGIADV